MICNVRYCLNHLRSCVFGTTKVSVTVRETIFFLRTYYVYEFLANDKCVVMTAAAANGKVYVVGAMAPKSKWRSVGSTLRSAAASFSLL
ncbi:hypothetical protein O6H91_Y171800 [Diphasiastrum complanatum]|nr:hypothetical protein O6H91_Y171800 [Diphasiastrum complanatum]